MLRDDIKMRILWVTPMLPGMTGGGQKRNLNLIKIAAAKHDVSVLSLIQPGEDVRVPFLEPFCRRIELVPFQPFVPQGKWHNRLTGWSRLLFDPRPQYARTFPVETMQEPLKRLMRELNPDLVFFAHLHTAELLPAAGDVPAILSEHNAEFEIIRRQQAAAGNLIHRFRDDLAWKKLLAFERYWIRRFPVCLAVSQRDAGILGELTDGKTRIQVVPNGIENAFFAPTNDSTSEMRSSIIFVGTMSYQPNADAAIYFCREIWPLIRQAKPDATLTIIGSKPAPEVLALQGLPGVTVTGFVEDTRPYYWQATTSVVPLRIGGGTRHKILESMAAGCPVVSTTLGAEGLDLKPDRDLLVADRPADFAACVVRLLLDTAQRDRLAQAGRQTAKLYDWSRVADSLEGACRFAVAHNNNDVSS